MNVNAQWYQQEIKETDRELLAGLEHEDKGAFAQAYGRLTIIAKTAVVQLEELERARDHDPRNTALKKLTNQDLS